MCQFVMLMANNAIRITSGLLPHTQQEEDDTFK